MSDLPPPGTGTVDILGIRFPLWSRDEALQHLLVRLRQHQTTGVCFPDMSSMNVACEQPDFQIGRASCRERV